jgi:mannose-6-phosphate isomerase-like protein (cupin superfamily)
MTRRNPGDDNVSLDAGRRACDGRRMSKKIKEFVTYWGPSVADWSDTEKRFVIERDETILNDAADGGRKMEKISLNDIFKEGVVTGVDMVNGYLPLVLYANEDMIIEVANCDREQGGWHRNIGADEWAFQYKGSRTLRAETGPVTINEGEMTVIPRGVSHQNVGHGPNIEITIYARKPLKRLCPTDAEEARKRMKIKNGKPIVPPVTLDDDGK